MTVKETAAAGNSPVPLLLGRNNSPQRSPEGQRLVTRLADKLRGSSLQLTKHSQRPHLTKNRCLWEEKGAVTGPGKQAALPAAGLQGPVSPSPLRACGQSVFFLKLYLNVLGKLVKSSRGSS